MKYLWISLSILALLLVACIGVNEALRLTTAAVVSPLEKAEAAMQAGQYEAAKDFASEAEQAWQHRLCFYASVLCHDETDAVSVGFAMLDVLPEEEFLSQCAELLYRLEHIQEMDRPLMHNLL